MRLRSEIQNTDSSFSRCEYLAQWLRVEHQSKIHAGGASNKLELVGRVNSKVTYRNTLWNMNHDRLVKNKNGLLLNGLYLVWGRCWAAWMGQ